MFQLLIYPSKVKNVKNKHYIKKIKLSDLLPELLKSFSKNLLTRYVLSTGTDLPGN